MTLDDKSIFTCGPTCTEPSLEEILADPIIRSLMARDRISDGTLRALMSHMRPECPGSPEAQDNLAHNTDQPFAEVAL